MNSALSLDDEEPEQTALSLDEEEPSRQAYIIKLHPDSPYAKSKMDNRELQGKVFTSSFKVLNVTDYDAGCDPSNPTLPAYRLITIIEVEV